MMRAVTRVAACDLMVALVAASAFMPAEARVPDEMASRLGTKRLSAGVQGDHTCFVRADGNVLCWGNNASGQIGDGTSGNVRNSPTPTGITTAVGLAVGSDHSCALLSTGLVQCWGSNASGQLGVGQATALSTIPVLVPGLTGVVSLAAGTGFTCARKSDGTVRCWGVNNFGQLGDDTTTSPRFSPVQVVNLTGAVKIVAGATHACALRVGGSMLCWGGNSQGQLGVGDDNNRDVPTAVVDIGDVTQMAAGLRFTCASRTGISTSGDHFCWGDNDLGQHGSMEVSNNSLRPVQITAIGAGMEVVAGETHACMVSRFDVPSCWGGNDSGQLGRGSASPFSPFRDAIPAIVVELTAGRKHSCLLASNDTVRCWGANALGQLGNAGDAPAFVPTQVLGLAGSVAARSIAAGTNHSCAVRAEGSGACWGRNDGAAIGDGTFTDRLVPTAIASAASGLGSFHWIIGGGNHSCARIEEPRATGTSAVGACWGDNRDGQIDPLATDEDFYAFPEITNGDAGRSAGSFHTCGRQSFLASCWGRNDSLALGNPDTTSEFAIVGDFRNVVAFAAAGAHTCVLHSTGRISCWGSNDFGQLGDGSRNDSATPREAAGVTNAVQLSATRDHACALLATGQVACWGRNDFGQVDGTLGGDRVVPTLVPGVAAGEAVGVTTGFQHSCILTVGGRVRCWGRNNNGQLGNNTTVNSLSTVEVLRASKVPVALANVVGLVSDAEHNCAVLTTGQPFCWGRNPEGQLGDGTRTRRLTASGVGSFAANVVRNAQLVANGRVVEIVALVNCPADARFTGRIFVTQGDVRANKAFNGACTEGLSEYPVDVHAQGPQGFTQGEALAEIDIVVHGKGGVIDDQHWTRRIELASPAP